MFGQQCWSEFAVHALYHKIKFATLLIKILTSTPASKYYFKPAGSVEEIISEVFVPEFWVREPFDQGGTENFSIINLKCP